MKNKKEQGNPAWNRGNVIGRIEVIEDFIEAFARLEKKLDKLIEEYTNGFGDETYNKLITKFQVELDELTNAKI